jgi:hypothetical protein
MEVIWRLVVSSGISLRTIIVRMLFLERFNLDPI